MNQEQNLSQEAMIPTTATLDPVQSATTQENSSQMPQHEELKKRDSQGSSDSKSKARKHPEGEEDHVSYSQGSSSGKKKMRLANEAPSDQEPFIIVPVILPPELVALCGSGNDSKSKSALREQEFSDS